MATRYLSDLAGTLKTFLRIATIRLKDVATVLHLRNKADDAFIKAAMDEVQLKGTTSGETGFRAPAAPAADLIYTLPAADGSTGQALTTDGAKGLAWADIATASNMVRSQTEVVAFNSASPIAVFTPPANAHIRKVTVDVETAFDAAGPSLSVGVAGSTSRYMGSTDVDLATVGLYEVDAAYEEDGTPDEVIISLGAGAGGTAGAARVTVEYALPG